MKEQNFKYFRDLRNGTTKLKFGEFVMTSFYNDVLLQLKNGKVSRAIKYGTIFPIDILVAYFKMKQIIKEYRPQHTDGGPFANI